MVIVSPAAAILTHISPRPNLDNSNPQAGELNLRQRMREVDYLIRQHWGLFAPQNGTLVISVWYEDYITLDYHRRFVAHVLANLTLNPVDTFYSVRDPYANINNPALGTVVVAGGGGGETRVWVEDREKIRIPSRPQLGQS